MFFNLALTFYLQALFLARRIIPGIIALKTPDEKKPTLRLYSFAHDNIGFKKESAILLSPLLI